MESLKSYKVSLEKRFRYHSGFGPGIVAFFTHSSIYKEAIDGIRKKSVRDALEADARQLQSNFKKGRSKL